MPRSPRSMAAEAATQIRRTERKTGKLDTSPADRTADTRATLEAALGLTAREQLTAWEFPDKSRLLLNNQTGRCRVPTSPKDRDIAENALHREKQRQQKQRQNET